MSVGFGGNEKSKIRINKDELNNLIKDYKKLKKYMKTNMFKIKTMDGTERIISELVEKYGSEE